VNSRLHHETKLEQFSVVLRVSVVLRAPNGIRTRAVALKGRCPGPLDDGDEGFAAVAALGHHPQRPPPGALLSIRECELARQPRPVGRVTGRAELPLKA
jgi:hypothetical protein